MKRPAALGLAGLALLAASSGAQTIGPDELLTIPYILKTPVISDFSLAPDGKRVALSISVVGKEAVWILESTDEPGAALATKEGWGERDVDWSPDGLALGFVSSRDGGWHVYVSDARGHRSRQLTSHAGEDKRPRFSPDGRELSYLSRRAATTTGWDLWKVPLEGGEPIRLTSEPFDEEDPRWSPDGKRIAVTLNGGHHDGRRLGVVDVATREMHPLLPEGFGGDNQQPRWSPNGEQIVFVSDEPGVKSLFTVAADGSAPPKRLLDSPNELTEPAWSPDGRYIAYLQNEDGDVKLHLYDVEKKTSRRLTLRNGVHRQPTWRRDGTAVLALFEAWNYPRDVWAYPVEGGRERVSETLPPELDVRKMVRPELLRYESPDGTEITGYLYLPEGASAEAKAKLLVRPHGGPTAQWMNGWHPFTQLLVQRGYAVFAPNVRGSTGFGVAFENLNDGDWGRGDLEDLVAGTRLVASRPEVRSDRVGIWGVSYGGFLTLAAITRHPDLFACAVEALGMPDLEKLYRETTPEGRSYLETELGPLAGHLALYRELSPLARVADVKAPLLSFHGEVYPLVPYSVKREFVEALRNRPSFPLVELIFKDEEARATYRHDLHPSAAWAYVAKILEFLDVYL